MIYVFIILALISLAGILGTLAVDYDDKIGRLDGQIAMLRARIEALEKEDAEDAEYKEYLKYLKSGYEKSPLSFEEWQKGYNCCGYQD